MKSRKLFVAAFLLLATVMCTVFSQGATRASQSQVAVADKSSGKKILVAYFSVTGNTKEIAKYVAEATGGDLFEIKPVVNYNSADLNWRDSACRALREQRDEDSWPEISKTVNNMEKYDVVFVAYPIWAGFAPRIIYTFLESYDLKGKTIVPFCTSGTSGIGSSVEMLMPLASKAEWKEGTRFAAGTFIEVVADWAKSAIK